MRYHRIKSSLLWLLVSLLAFLPVLHLSPVLSQSWPTQKFETDNALVVQNGHWIPQAAGEASGGSYLYNQPTPVENQAPHLLLQFSGTSVEIMYVTGPGMGTLAIEVDGTVLRTVITASESVVYGQIARIDYLSDEAHTLRVYAQAGGVVGLDAFVIPDTMLPTSSHSERNLYVEDLQTRAVKGERVSVIAGLDVPSYQLETKLSDPQQVQTQRAVVASAKQDLLRQFSSKQARVVSNSDQWVIPYLALNVDKAGLDALIASPEVIFLQENHTWTPALFNTTAVVDADLAWQMGFEGAGQTVAIIDTAVETTHEFFNGRVVEEACFSGGEEGATSLCSDQDLSQFGPGAAAPPDPIQCLVFGTCSHGTHVAGIAAGNHPNPDSMDGVARSATIIAVKVGSRYENPIRLGIATADVISALLYVYSLREEWSIAAVNLSLGGGAYTDHCDSQEAAVKATIDLLRGVNIATIASSGNDNSSTFMGAPGCISTAVSVGMTNNNDQVAYNIGPFGSNSNETLDLLAPGFQVYSSVMGGGYDSETGTSMAAPHVTGAWAILKSRSPNASVADILTTLQNNGVPVTDPRNGITRSRIDIDNALMSITSETCNAASLPVRASINGDNQLGNQASQAPSLSSDGRYVAFQSWASNLTPGDTNGRSDIFVYDRQTCQTTLISRSSAGVIGDGDSQYPSISGDGRYVVFQSTASNLVENDTFTCGPSPSCSDVFLHDRTTGETRRLSYFDTLGQGNGPSYYATISRDGSRVAFVSEATNFASGDTNDAADVFLRGVSTEWIVRVSVASSSTQGDSGSGTTIPALSSDGRYVAFQSNASNLVLMDDNEFGLDVFVHDVQLSVTTLESRNSDGEQARNQVGHHIALSDDGRYVAFSSIADNLSTLDTLSQWQLYVRDRQTGQTTLISQGGGTGGNDESFSPSFSADGRYVGFVSYASNLHPSADGRALGFVADRQTGTIELVSRSATGGLPDNHLDAWLRLSGDGRMVAFSTDARNLIAWEDLYLGAADQVYLAAVNPLYPATNLNAYPLSSHQVRLFWTDGSVNESGYVVERQVFPYGSFQAIITLSANVTEYIDPAAPIGTGLNYRVRATRSDGIISPYSNVAATQTYWTTPDSLTLFRGSTAAFVTNLNSPLTSADYWTQNLSLSLNSPWVMGDWNGDNIATPGVYDSGLFFYTNNYTDWTWIWLGLVGRPVVAGRFSPNVIHDCIGVVDRGEFPPHGTAFVLYSTCDMSGGIPPLAFQWLSVLLPTNQGHSGTFQFMAGDFDNNGVDSIAVRRGRFIAWTNIPPTTLMSQFSLAQYIGAPGTGDEGQLVVGDWNDDGYSSFGLYYQNGDFYRRDDLDWNSQVYYLQRLGQPLGSPTSAVSWRQ